MCSHEYIEISNEAPRTKNQEPRNKNLLYTYFGLKYKEKLVKKSDAARSLAFIVATY